MCEHLLYINRCKCQSVLCFFCIISGANSQLQMGRCDYSRILAGAECTECAMLPTNQGFSRQYKNKLCTLLIAVHVISQVFHKTKICSSCTCRIGLLLILKRCRVPFTKWQTENEFLLKRFTLLCKRTAAPG